MFFWCQRADLLKKFVSGLVTLIAILTFSVHLDCFAEGVQKKNNAEPKPAVEQVTETKSVDPLNIVGAGVGSLFGFGIGHPFQGRYLDRGWLFTVAEFSGVILLIQGGFMGDCEPGVRRCGNETIRGLGALLFVGGRVWEIVDLWTHLRDEPVQVVVAPSPLHGHHRPRPYRRPARRLPQRRLSLPGGRPSGAGQGRLAEDGRRRGRIRD